MNPADTFYDPRFDNMERERQLKAAARWIMDAYGPDSEYAKHRSEYQAWLDTHGVSLSRGDELLLAGMEVKS